MAAKSVVDADSVFINCPFTGDYTKSFHSIIFAVLSCGFRPRTAMEAGDAGDVRLDKIIRLVVESPFSIHDLSEVGLDRKNKLPRFNMPFELGLVIACKKAGGRKFSSRPILVMENERYTTQKCLSDIAGQDVKAHGKSPAKIINIVREWLAQQSARKGIPGHLRIQAAFTSFYGALPALCAEAGLNARELGYSDFVVLAQQWLVEANAESAIKP